jgi:hypothetical protein
VFCATCFRFLRHASFCNENCNLVGPLRKYLLKFGVLWDVAPCNVIEVDRRLRDAYCLHHQSDDKISFANGVSI